MQATGEITFYFGNILIADIYIYKPIELLLFFFAENVISFSC